MTVEIQDAEQRLSQLAESAANGEEVILLLDGKPVARISSLAQPLLLTEEGPKRRLALLEGQFEVPDDIKTPFKAEIEEMFYGNPGKLIR